ncbi:MAG: DUF4381 domain-containing protein, partial [Roseobacter sp.]|nr:DUF4381 domain-containing protein [Roseobacter sp.]
MNDDLSQLNLVELFDLLVQPDVPARISMMPQTIGWVWLGAAVCVFSGYALWRWVQWRRATAYRRAALAALRQANDDPVAIAKVLRRTALAAFPRDTVAGLYGERWLAFLDSVTESVKFSGTTAGQALVRAPYRPQA